MLKINCRIWSLLVVFFLPALLCAQAGGDLASGVSDLSYAGLIEGVDPMDVSDLDPQVASILSNYYLYNYTSKENWDRLESFRIYGSLLVSGQEFEYTAYQKKPNSCKVVLSKRGRQFMIMSYDGQDAWQANLDGNNPPVSMEEAEAMNFIRDAAFGGHLFYPKLAGKSVDFKGTSVISGRRCFELMVTLPNGQRISSFIGMLDFREYQRTTINASNGDVEVATNLEFRDFEGVRFPVLTETRIEGALVHAVEVHDVKINKGTARWMFARSSVLSGSSNDAFAAEEVPLQSFSADLGSPASVSERGSFLQFTEPSAFGQVDGDSGSAVDDLKNEFPFLK
ncbi:MAG: hypothetical protein ACSHYA_05710 [Opitutaceae bacterium]